MQKNETPSSCSNSSTSLDVVEIPPPDNTVSTVLLYCKRTILRPYLRLLTLAGLRPLAPESRDAGPCLRVLGAAYAAATLLLLAAGGALQFAACLRRDRGLPAPPEGPLMAAAKGGGACQGSALFSFAAPAGLLVGAYAHLMCVLRSSGDEQLPVLMERVFLISTNLSTGFMSQRKLVRTLWFFIICGLVWMTLAFIVVNYMMSVTEIHFKWMEKSSPSVLLLMKILLVVSTLWQDLAQVTIVSNYCLQAQLLTSYVRFMKEKLLQFPVQPLGWMRDIEDFKKLLNHLNEKIAPSVCLLAVMDISFALSGLLWIFQFDNVDKETLPIFGVSIINVVLWILISAIPFIQASRLSGACEVLKSVGQEARTRPYVHQDTPTVELDSVLLYTTSLKISAKLFHLPITGRKLCFCVTVLSIVVLSLGQCHYFISH